MHIILYNNITYITLYLYNIFLWHCWCCNGSCAEPWSLMLGCRVSWKELWDFWWKRTKYSMSSFKTNLLRLPRVRWDEASPNVFWVLDCDDVMMYHLQIITRNQSDTIWRNIFHKDFFLTFYVGLDNGRRGLMFFRPKSLPSLRYCTSFWGRERRRYRGSWRRRERGLCQPCSETCLTSRGKQPMAKTRRWSCGLHWRSPDLTSSCRSERTTHSHWHALSYSRSKRHTHSQGRYVYSICIIEHWGMRLLLLDYHSPGFRPWALYSALKLFYC